MDQYSKRTNLIVDGIQMRRGETPDQLRQTLLQEIEWLDLEIDDSEVDRAHRTSAPYRDTNGKLQQAVIVRFVSWGARNVMYQSRKSSKYRFRASLTNERQSTLIHARKQIETDPSVASHIKFVFADKNCRLQASCVNGRLLSFTTADEFDGLVNYLDHTTKNNQLLPQVAEKYELILSEDIKEWESTTPSYADAVRRPQSEPPIEKDWLGIPTLVNLKGKNINSWIRNSNNLYIGRPSKWGNPFCLTNFPRALCVAKYFKYIQNSDVIKDIGELKSKSIGCFCAPSLCHGHVLIHLYKEFINAR